MKKIAWAFMGVFAAGGVFAGEPDWSKVTERKIKLFYPGQSGLEWILNKADHSAVPDIVNKKRACSKCHEGDANEVGDKIIKGNPVGNSKTQLEPKPIADRAGWVPASFKMAHDGQNLYVRVEWEQPKGGSFGMDKKNEVKLAMMFDGGISDGGTPAIDLAERAGCWVTCHNDLRSMKEAKDDKKTKYIKGAALDGGKFMDLIQWRSGKGEKPVDGFIADKRVMEGGKGLVKAEGKKDGNKWVVTFTRALAGGGTGDHKIEPGKIYDFGFALHDGGAEARYHYVSLNYQFGLDKAVEGVKYYYNVVKQ
ncbi:ethylbenzene dehydrogenase-related protein [Sulfuricystis multivorans]|uniref:ethylbenzene dehydrogenase-related protein n=1 Tax=Sulfuricystis multivorans TaxID=2211108 RepID=UPI0015584507|nr:ethylbenzene dehydrogenase-related protein [Sulfuricystis multivorans]